MKVVNSMPTITEWVGNWPIPSKQGPRWKVKWDWVLGIAKGHLAKATWPTKDDFIDIKTTTPKSRGAYRLFRVYKNGEVQLWKGSKSSEAVRVEPRELELTTSHIEEFDRLLGERLGA